MSAGQRPEVGRKIAATPARVTVLQSSADRGLADDGTRFQLPLEVGKKFGPWLTDLEFGPLVSTVGRSEWLYGIVGGLELGKATAVMAELHGESRSNFTNDVLTLNFGLRQELSETRILILSAGHELRSADQARALIGYFGLQLVF